MDESLRDQLKYNCFYWYIILMQEREGEEQVKQTQKKNQKNIYVHKINSLIKISQDHLPEDQREINSTLNKKKIKKVRSQTDKNALKLQKNRESAKRARLRKKLYIKLLEGQVDHLKEVAREGERIEREAQQFLKMINIKQQANDQLEDEVQRYLSRDNIANCRRNEQEVGDVPARMDKLIEEICQLSMCSPLRNIRQLSSKISLQQILRGENPQKEGEELQEIIKEVLFQGEQLRQIYTQMVRQNENIKRCIESQQQRHDGFNNYSEPHDQKQSLNYVSYLRGSKQGSSIFINLNEAQKILIQADSFLQLDGINQQI